MYFTHWRAFQAVALEGSFTGAAKRLNRSQPTITRQVGELEAAFGVELFHRGGRGVELSALGKSLLAVTERLFTTSEEAVELLQSAGELSTGHLRIHAVNPIDIVIPIAAYRAAHPGVSVSLVVCNSEEALNALLDFRCDVAMLATTADDRRLHYVDFGTRPLVVCLSVDHPWHGRRRIGFKQLDGMPIIVRERGSRTRAMFENACYAAGVTPRIAMEVNNRDAFREAVARGLGLGIIGQRGLAEDRRLGEVALSEGVLMRRQVACLRERREARLLRAFLEVCERIAPTI